MAKKKPELPEGWDTETFVLAKLLTHEAKVLFIYNEDYTRLRQLSDIFKLDITILNDNLAELEKASINFGFDVAQGNVNAGALTEYADGYFDYVIAENVLHSARYPGDFLKDLVRVGKQVILCNENKAIFAKRMRFLLSGSFFVRNQYEIVPDDEYAWFNRFPWILSHKDVVNLCVCQGITIQKGTIIYKNGYIDNMYDIRSYPNLTAYKVYYLLSNNGTSNPSYRLGGATFG